MRISLRWKILLLAVFTPATLGLATLLTVHRNVTEHVNSSSIHENLEHSVSVFEGMLRTRSNVLAGSAQVIAQDPRFFSLLLLASNQRDSRFVTTVRGVARDFSRITPSDIFEVVDRRGRMLASVGSASSSRAARDSLVKVALRGRAIESILIERDAHYQVVLAPVVADHQIVGVLLLGAQIGSELARELRAQMRCEVTFLSGTTITGTTLRDPEDRAALLRMLGRLELSPASDLRTLGVQRVNGPHFVYLTLVQRIPVSARSAQQLYVMQRSFDPETSFLHVMQEDMLVLAIIALVLALITGLFFSEQIIRPMQRLVRGAQEMEQGNYDYPLGIKRRDEIGYLADRFAEMRQRERAYLNSLEHTARLKSQFLSIASHELRTPISVLRGYRDLLADGTLGTVTPKQQKALEAMRDYLTRLTRVAEDASHFAEVKGERLMLDFQPHDVEPILRRAVGAALAEGARRAVHVEVQCDTMSEHAECDADNLGNAIMQLVTNGIRFTPDGGRVDVHATEREGSLHIEVKDTGIGISEEKLRVVLSHGLSGIETNHHQSAQGLEFNSTGLGLGLSIACGIVEAHGGIILAESRLGEGSTFVIVVPMTRRGDARAAA